MWERIARVDARVWFSCALVLAAAGYVVREATFSPWLILQTLILAGIWWGSQLAWWLLVTLTAIHAILLASFGVASLFATALTVETNGWSLAADGTALILLVAFRASRRHSAQSETTLQESAPGAT